jgi:hypothetical protein
VRLEPHLVVPELAPVTRPASKAGEHESHAHGETGSIAVQLDEDVDEIVRVCTLRLLFRESHDLETLGLRELEHDRIATQAFLSLAFEIKGRRVFFTGNVTPVKRYVQKVSL